MSRRDFSPHPELSELFTHLWAIDDNRLEADVDYEIDLQGRICKSTQGEDRARGKFFARLNEEFFQKPTYKAFIVLLDNYESETGAPEVVTEQEANENWNFLTTIMETRVMQAAHQFLVDRNLASSDVEKFKYELYDIWFKLYRRTSGDRDLDSSGFEHVFVGETRGHKVIGFHNWIQFYLQEKHGNIDYKGYFRWGTDDESGKSCRIVKLQFGFKGDGTKPLGSVFVGTSPEFEFALYTVAFLVNQGRPVDVKIGEYNMKLGIRYHGYGIGTAYPDLVE